MEEQLERVIDLIRTKVRLAMLLLEPRMFFTTPLVKVGVDVLIKSRQEVSSLQVTLLKATVISLLFYALSD